MRTEALLTEETRIVVCGEGVSEFFNALSLHNIRFYHIAALSRQTYELTVPIGFERTVLKTAEQFRLSAAVRKKRGLLHLLRRFRGRCILLLSLFLLLVWVLRISSCIWEIEVVGNDSVSSAAIIDALDELGIGIGSSGLHIHNERIRSLMQSKIPKLSYLAVQVYGSRARIVVHERIEKPKMADEGASSAIVAKKTGLITKISTLSGKPLVKRGELVLQGQKLITGDLDDLQGGTRHVPAMGDIWARTWCSSLSAVPLSYDEKCYTGRELKFVSWKICNFRINLYSDSGIPYAFYDKITSRHRYALFGYPLPWERVETVVREYDPVMLSLDAAECAKDAESRMTERLKAEVKELSVCERDIRSDDAMLYVSLTVECLEQIGTAAEVW